MSFSFAWPPIFRCFREGARRLDEHASRRHAPHSASGIGCWAKLGVLQEGARPRRGRSLAWCYRTRAIHCRLLPSSPGQPSVLSMPSNRVCPCTLPVRAPLTCSLCIARGGRGRSAGGSSSARRRKTARRLIAHSAARLLLCASVSRCDAIVMAPDSPDRGGVRGACMSWPHGLFAVRRCGQQVGTLLYVSGLPSLAV